VKAEQDPPFWVWAKQKLISREETGPFTGWPKWAFLLFAWGFAAFVCWLSWYGARQSNNYEGMDEPHLRAD
jgi:hypothetical protein